MATDVQYKKTDSAFVAEMIELVETTHWCTGNLGCPVYKREPIIGDDGRIALDIWGKPRMKNAVVNGQYVIEKFTYCLVGLIMKVAGLKTSAHDGVELAEQLGTIRFEAQLDYPGQEQSRRIVEVFFDTLNEMILMESSSLYVGGERADAIPIFTSPFAPGSEADIKFVFREKFQALESWNDSVERDAVLQLMKKVYTKLT